MGHATANLEPNPDWATTETLSKVGSRPMQLAGLAAAGGLGVAVVLGGMSQDGWKYFFHSYLQNFCFFVSLALGGLFFVAIQHITRAGWSVVVRRIAEIVAASVIPMSILFLPILLTVVTKSSVLYEWNDAEHVKHDVLLQHKASFLNATWFVIRCVVYFVVWAVLSRFFLKQSLRQDQNGDPQITFRMEGVSALALILFALTITFASIDWMMSLAPHWFSTMFGVYYFSGSVMGFLALLAVCTILLQRRGILAEQITVEHRHDIGKLLFGFMCFWAYIAFSQYMLIWYANIPEETGWYIIRQSNGWEYVSIALIVLHFVVPFFGMVSRSVKRNPTLLFGWAVFLLVMHWVDIYWLVMPQLAPEAGPAFGLLDIACFIGLGGAFVASMLWTAADLPLIPVRDPRLAESLAFKNI